MKYLDAEPFTQLARTLPVIDVRSPGEYAIGHIPGAVSIPLFDNEERSIVGTMYKKTGKDAAIRKGLEIAGKHLPGYISELDRVANGNKQIAVYCWRGGMRSRNMAWLFEVAGYDTTLLTGGYKAYRRFVRSRWSLPWKLIILGGKTGSGKSVLLNKLKAMGEQVIDLEGLANHRGSAFGHIGLPEQPTNETFENNLWELWHNLDPNRWIWLEDESMNIGRVVIPPPLFEAMRVAPVIFLDIPKEERILHLIKEYAILDKPELAAAIGRIEKRLGGQNVKNALEALRQNDFETVADITLLYYDKAYLIGVSRRDPGKVFNLSGSISNPEKLVIQLKAFLKEIADKIL